MKALLYLIEQVAVRGLVNRKAPSTGNNKLGLGLMALSGLLFCVALVFAILSFYGYVLIHYTQPIAALIVSGSVVAASLICSLIGYSCLKKKQQKPSSLQDNDITQIISEITDMIGEEWAETIQENPKTAVLLAGVAGLVAGERLN